MALKPTANPKLPQKEIVDIIFKWLEENPFLVDFLEWIEEKSGFWDNWEEWKEGEIVSTQELEERYNTMMQKYIRGFEVGKLRMIKKEDLSDEIPQAMRDRWEEEEKKYIEEVDKICYEWKEEEECFHQGKNNI